MSQDTSLFAKQLRLISLTMIETTGVGPRVVLIHHLAEVTRINLDTVSEASITIQFQAILRLQVADARSVEREKE